MDPLEERIRAGLSADGWRLPTDEQLLARVHTGAAARRRRRTALGAAASVVVLAGIAGAGAFVLGDPNSLGDNVATGSADVESTTDQQNQSETMIAPEDGDEGGSGGSESERSSPTEPDPDTDETPNSTMSDRVPSGFRPMSVTAANTNSYWVLGEDPRRDDRTPLARTKDGGGSFAIAGEVPAPSATSTDDRTTETVSEVRFVDGMNGWAYGGALWSTHDGGNSWERVSAIPGTVMLLEAAGGHAYAVVDQDGSYSLWRSPAGEEGWEQRAALNDPGDLTAVQNLVVVTDRNGDDTQLVVSTDQGENFTRTSSPCEASLDPGALSATTDALWLTCPSGTSVTVQVSTDSGRTWDEVRPDDALTNAGMATGARNARNLVAAAEGEVIKVAADGGTDTISVDGLATPVFVGFTEPSVGYVLDSNGGLFRTEDAGVSWNQVRVN